jgi:transposase
MDTITVGVDLSKCAFSTCTGDARGRVMQRRELGRESFSTWLTQLPAGTVVAMEACSGAHHWGRRCQAMDLQPRLMAARFVSPFRKSSSSKNDRNDAEAIMTAGSQGNMRFVPVKTIDQQVRLSWHRAREGYKAEALAMGNRIRGLLAEFGVVVAKGESALRRRLADLAVLKLPDELAELLLDLSAHWRAVHKHVAACERRIAEHADADARCVQMRAMTGVGPITADAMAATVGSAHEFRNGRQCAAWIGLVPRQYSTGGRVRLGRSSCQGDAYLRTLLIQGARSAEQRAKAVPLDKATPEQLWILSLQSRLPFGKRMVAIANKHARQLWAMLARGEDYDPHAGRRHPMAQRATRARAQTTPTTC